VTRIVTATARVAVSQYFVAGGVSVFVVDLHQSVDIDQEQRERRIVPAGPQPLATEPCVERSTVREAGHRSVAPAANDSRGWQLGRGARCALEVRRAT
jgi:hypothetical protein